MEFQHNVYFENISKDSKASTHTKIYFDLAYTSYTIVKDARISTLIREYDGEYQESVFNGNPSTNQSCSLCGRTKSHKEITGTIEKTLDNEEPTQKTINMCKSCSESVQKRISNCLREHYPTQLTLNKL
jgi:hypothetical protein